MWNRSKKEEDIQQRPAPAPAPDYSKEAIPMSTYATRQVEHSSTRAGAAIGKNLAVVGQISGKEDLLIDGRLDGDVDLPENRLTVGPSGHLQGRVRAREIVIHGAVQGNLEASERVEIKKNARVIGDLKAQRPVIEDEAYFKGNVETIRVDAPKPAAKPQPAAAPAPESQPSLLSPDAKQEPRKG
ncbi:MAG: polymer-forming cytoskeletal protein [Acidobacteria bacterium]|nr:polymer-forming cytoskeletal protein [Acidobacteriota bacterium]